MEYLCETETVRRYANATKKFFDGGLSDDMILEKYLHV